MSHRHASAVLAVVVSFAVLTPVASFAAGNGTPPGDPGQSMAKMAADLGVSADAFNACFASANPMPSGDKSGNPPQDKPPASPQGTPGDGPGQQMKAELLSCLQAVNAGITSDQLDAVMGKYRPAAPGDGPGAPGSNGAPPSN